MASVVSGMAIALLLRQHPSAEPLPGKRVVAQLGMKADWECCEGYQKGDKKSNHLASNQHGISRIQGCGFESYSEKRNCVTRSRVVRARESAKSGAKIVPGGRTNRNLERSTIWAQWAVVATRAA